MGAPVVRWRNAPRRRWRYGRLRRELPDGNVEVIDDRTGALRTLRPEVVEFKVAGRRGGVVWVVPWDRCLRAEFAEYD